MRKNSSKTAARRGRSLRLVLLPLLIAAVLGLTACSNNPDSVFSTNPNADTTSDVARVPWDYRVVEGTVGDLVGSDMTILPDNELLPNDNNYATGDKVWTLQYMDAEMTTDADQKNTVKLSAWSTIKSYKDLQSATDDLKNLKVSVTTDVDLVGVYKTEYKGKTRNFAVVELPSGNRIKQPIDAKRYTDMEKKKVVSVVLEEVHDFADYDLAYAKFRGWAK
ncbi:Gram-positive signal peptide protein, YSIRK family [Paenibacillus stellifer]|uniref:Gram-positive signal peptide protein, YSIRK family n=1 Tax=Paenibacillus stellifer TaxID=169760 RepID=A0A089M3I9_9BACL|nr:hypothetical protein [Paenibacillus stellifer]AIQ66068.1 Gram-positive signal peptide protein, YSIRK family [Paenibacillus stellifer]